MSVWVTKPAFTIHDLDNHRASVEAEILDDAFVQAIVALRG
jgi:hypothetical protein